MAISGMSVGGVAPSILRELSGVYKPFVKAFKELVCNAFDADADNVTVEFSDDFSTVTIVDDGVAMSPFEFRNDFARIGGRSRRWPRGRTPKGRAIIGSKGIGFLALARYCDRMEVSSSRKKTFKCRIRLENTPATMDFRSALGVPIGRAELGQRLSFKLKGRGPRGGELRQGSHYRLSWKKTRLAITKDVGPVDILVSVDCRNLGFKATLDFDRLLRLADTADLEKLEDFATIEIHDLAHGAPTGGTRITAGPLKGFVRRGLRADRRKGFVRNVASRRGLDRFVWNLSRCTPVSYTKPVTRQGSEVRRILDAAKQARLKRIEVRHGKESCLVERPVYPFEPDAPPIQKDMMTSVNIDEDGLKAVGFLAGYESIIFPAEYRGISIRVRGVAIGDPGFLGAENILTGAQKAALSQITGEIIVMSGLDALDAINPGRESFYEENKHYKTLRRHILGEGEMIRGHLGQTISAVLRRSQVRSWVRSLLGRATYLRHAMEDISSGVTHLVSHGGTSGIAIRRMLKSRRSHTNGLASARNLEFGVPAHLGGIPVVRGSHLPEPAMIDFEVNQITVDTSRQEWDSSLVLHNRRFDVLHKVGKPTQPIAEVDFRAARIYVNWGHPVRPQMDERGFVRTALAWVLAKEAGQDDADQMMDLAVKLLAFTAHRDG